MHTRPSAPSGQGGKQGRRWLVTLAVAVPMIIGGVPAAIGADVALDDYRLGIGDRVSVNAFGRADLTGEFAVGADAQIRIPLVGAVPAAGRSRQEIEDDISVRLAKLLDYQTPVTVDIAVYRPVFVIGDVTRPGEVVFVPGMTAMEAYARAGGTPSLRQLPSQVASGMATAQRDLMVAQSNLTGLLVRRAALDAALDEKAEITLPSELQPMTHSPLVADALTREMMQLQAEREDLATRLQLMERQRDHLGEEIEALEKQIAYLEVQAKSFGAELDKIDGLASRGLATSARLLELKRIKADTDGERFEAAAFLSRAKQQRVALELRVQELRHELRTEHLEARRIVDTEIAEARALFEGARLQMAALSQVDLAEFTAGGGELELSISRNEGGEARTFPATSVTPVLPGDIIQVTASELAPAQAALPSRHANLRPAAD